MRRAALATFVALLCAVTAGCGVLGIGRKSSVEEGLTDAMARQQVYDYLRKTLAELPPGVSWSLRSDADRPQLGPGDTLVCSDSDGASPADSPVNVGLDYWLIGVPHGQEHAYFELLRKIWLGWGWSPRPDSDDKWAAYDQPGVADGYALVVTDAQNGPGSVSVGVSSPCFWSKGDATVDPPLRDAQPRVIERPAD